MDRQRTQHYIDDNRRNWDARAPLHAGATTGYQLDRYRQDPTRLSGVVEFDRRYLGDLSGKSLLHLQCHIGTDTLSLARLGAEVTGVDLSTESLRAARELFASVETTGRFVAAEVYDTAEALPGEVFDVVYTSVGALNWLPDISRWGRVVATMLAPGGTFYVRDGHPMAYTLGADLAEDPSDVFRVMYPYFETPEPLTTENDETYVDTNGAKVTQPRIHEWNHGLGEVFTALTSAGLVVTLFEEHRGLEWPMFPNSEEIEGRWYLPQDQRDRCPMMFSMRATKPGGSPRQ